MYQQKQKIKAAFLLLMFLNTVVSFACSVGLVDFSDHHKHDDNHSHDKSHSHEKDNHNIENVGNHQHSNANHQSPSEEEKNCCSDDVVKIQATDKNITKANQNPLPLSIELAATLHTFILSLSSNHEASVKPAPPFLRWQATATIPDLRIAIQSFQI